MPYQTSIASVSSRRSRSWSTPGDLDGIAEAPGRLGRGEDPLVIRLKRDANANVVLNNLYKQTPLQTSFAGQHGGPGRRGAPHAQPGPDADALRRPPDRGRHPPVGVPAEQGPGPGPHRRGPAQGHRHDRRGHRRHPGLRRPAGGHGVPPGGAVRVLRGAGQPHPGHDAGPTHPPGPGQPRGGDGQAARDDRRARVDPRRRRPSCAGSSPASWARSGTKFANDRRADHHLRPGRHGRRGPDRRRGAGRHHDPGRLREGRLRRRLPDPGPRGARRAGGQAEGGGPRRRRRPHQRARLPAVLLQPGPGVPAAGASRSP